VLNTFESCGAMNLNFLPAKINECSQAKSEGEILV
jgi:hypothetical protein